MEGEEGGDCMQDVKQMKKLINKKNAKCDIWTFQCTLIWLPHHKQDDNIVIPKYQLPLPGTHLISFLKFYINWSFLFTDLSRWTRWALKTLFTLFKQQNIQWYLVSTTSNNTDKLCPLEETGQRKKGSTNEYERRNMKDE